MTPDHERSRKTTEILGLAAVFFSAFFFYLSTAVIRWSQAHVNIDPSFYVFARFLLGFLVVCTVQVSSSARIRPLNVHLLIGRTVANGIAVYCFYRAVTLTSVAEANILNMTYPLFIALFSWIFLKDQRDSMALAAVLVAFAGVWLILAPGDMHIGLDNLWGLASGISAAAAIVYLNLSRQYHDTHTILFFMFGLGAVIVFALFHRHMFIPNARELYYLLLCAGFGIGGQYLLTIGFRYVTAVEGSVISSSRILLAALLGPIIVSDPALELAGWFGALLIFSANVVLALRKVSY